MKDQLNRISTCYAYVPTFPILQNDRSDKIKEGRKRKWNSRRKINRKISSFPLGYSPNRLLRHLEIIIVECTGRSNCKTGVIGIGQEYFFVFSHHPHKWCLTAAAATALTISVTEIDIFVHGSLMYVVLTSFTKGVGTKFFDYLRFGR